MGFVLNPGKYTVVIIDFLNFTSPAPLFRGCKLLAMSGKHKVGRDGIPYFVIFSVAG
jgi:hypothetical protein